MQVVSKESSLFAIDIESLNGLAGRRLAATVHTCIHFNVMPCRSSDIILKCLLHSPPTCTMYNTGELGCTQCCSIEDMPVYIASYTTCRVHELNTSLIHILFSKTPPLLLSGRARRFDLTSLAERGRGRRANYSSHDDRRWVTQITIARAVEANCHLKGRRNFNPYNSVTASNVNM